MDNALYTYTATAIDTNRDDLYFHLISGPSGMAVDSVSGAVSWSPDSSNVGANPFSVAVVDNQG